MATYQDITNNLRDQARVVGSTEIADDNFLNLAQLTVSQLRGRGVFVPVTENTITLAANTYEYAVPASFAYISRLNFEDAVAAGTYTHPVPAKHWEITTSGPNIKFYKGFPLTVGLRIQVVGQGRPTIPSAISDTVPDSLLGVVQQGIEYRLWGVLSQGRSELSFDRANQRKEAKAEFEVMASSGHFRLWPNSRQVPGR